MAETFASPQTGSVYTTLYSSTSPKGTAVKVSARLWGNGGRVRIQSKDGNYLKILGNTLNWGDVKEGGDHISAEGSSSEVLAHISNAISVVGYGGNEAEEQTKAVETL